MPRPLTIRLFVYGSLCKGQRNHARMTGARFLGSAATPSGRYVLRPLEGYLALADGPGPSVRGELYAVSEQLIAALDSFEGVPTLYDRKPVALSDGTFAEAYFKA